MSRLPSQETSASLMCRPMREAGFFQPVRLAEVKRFGHRHCYGDARQYTVAELQDGRIVLAPLAEQTEAVRNEIKRRMLNEEHPNYRALSRDVPELFSWEVPAIVGAITLADFPEAIRPHAEHRKLMGVPPDEVYGWLVNGRALSYDKKAHAWLKSNGFSSSGRKWIRPDQVQP